ncbi:MAG: DUF3526 domain-containing protein [Microscillaceae bacterium]|nr:DUF3526 domain-containing protein [Microscillaceae bacterium]
MLFYHLKYEFISLFRNRWIQTLSFLLLIMCLFAAYNGQQKVVKRVEDIQKAKAEVQKGDSLARLVLDSLEAGHEVSIPEWRRPNLPTTIGFRHPRVADMPPAPLALIAVGQSDMFTHYVQPTLSGEDFTMNFSELSSPVQLLFGSFDLAFVLIYLLPLVVIAFSYNLLSAEREQGSLRLLASQHVYLLAWLFQKAMLRFMILTIVIIPVIVIALGVQGVNLADNLRAIGAFLGLSIVYALFWFSLALGVNLVGKSSSGNAINLLALWVFLVLLVPSAVNQLANSLYPLPSRAQMINNMRVLQAEAEKEQDKILDNYLRNHPELAQKDTSAQEENWWFGYFAAQDLVRNKMRPIVAQYDGQLVQQQTWINQWRFLSPAILLQDSFQELAQTSTRHYQSYREQIMAFTESWRGFLIPLVFKDQKVDQKILASLPRFGYQIAQLESHYGWNLGAMTAYVLLLWGFSVLVYQQKKTGLALG